MNKNENVLQDLKDVMSGKKKKFILDENLDEPLYKKKKPKTASKIVKIAQQKKTTK